jgi:hypothetical protein
MSRLISAPLLVGFCALAIWWYHAPEPPGAPAIGGGFAYHQADEYGYYFASDGTCATPLRFTGSDDQWHTVFVSIKELNKTTDTAIYQCQYGLNVLAKTEVAEPTERKP